MSNIDERIDEIKNLVLGVSSSVKDLQTENVSIRGQLQVVQDITRQFAQPVDDNEGYRQFHDPHQSPLLGASAAENTSTTAPLTDSHNLPVHSLASTQSPASSGGWPPGAQGGAQTFSFQHTYPGNTNRGLLATPTSAPTTTGGPPPQSFQTSSWSPYAGGYPAHHLSAASAVGPSYTPTGQFRDTAPRSYELQSAYKAIQDRWKHLKLEPDYVFSDSSKGLRKEDIPVHAVVASTAHMLETGFRIFSEYTHEKGLAPEPANELYLVMCHMFRSLQDKQCSLMVNHNYDPDFSKQYQSIMSGNTNMRQENIEALNMTQSIMKHRNTGRQQQQHHKTQGGNRSQGGKKNNFKQKGKKTNESRSDDAPQED